ncbi:MAG: selenocysteine-specific translation elongation factor [Candidatus Cloacimonetes bacterium]|nr:selenocysteine-specific translation elongation factor [Candidatus Cloacimonadota bacterium]
MTDKHIIMGTAGHVDHGKTSLIRALTGFDCDTHKQEKERGITMNLGFTHLELPDGSSVGIVDVPGHADFIKTMVSGACGIDFVMLVIAADEGIMPQTEEHLQIMKTLGIQYGIIVLTKIDLVDKDLLEMATEEVETFVKDSFLKDAPVVKVSSETNQGLDELAQTITDIIQKIPQRNFEGTFRMYADRVFSREGFGTIVNGSILSGSITKERMVFLLPGKRELRIRKIEHHGKEVEKVSAGDRASFNLVGFKQKDFRRGMVLSDRPIKETNLVDAKITVFQKDVKLGLWNQVIFLLGTNRLMARIHLLDEDVLENRKTCLAQVYLPKPIIAQYEDKFIIRNSSGNLTLGGGQIIDPYPLHHRRRRDAQIEIVRKISSGKLHELVAAEVRKSALPVTHKEVASKLDLTPDELIDVIFRQLPGDIIFYQSKDRILLLMKKFNTAMQNKILTDLQEFHKKHPLKETGKTFNELLGIFGIQPEEKTKLTLKLILQNLEEEGKIKQVKQTWTLVSHDVRLDDRTKIKIENVNTYLKSVGNNFIDLNTIFLNMQKEEMSEKKLNQILSYLTDKKEIYFIQMKYIHADFLEEAKELLIDHLKQNKEGITVAQFRDMIRGNRNTALLLLEFFDGENLTKRKGNYRFLKKKIVRKDLAGQER